MNTAVATAGSHEEGARRALLQRLADGLGVLDSAGLYVWTCCWLDYTGYGEPWRWQMCGGRMPGRLPEDRDGRWRHCGHWHHRTEIFLA